MSRMTKQNLHNIKCRFEEKTGTDLNPAHRMGRRFPVRKLMLVAAVIVCGLAMAAFTYPLFSSLDGDELALNGSYLGGGIVSVDVENRSDKVLQFQNKVKLFSWNDGEVEAHGEVKLENTRFEPQCSGTMTVDLSGAYDIETLETTLPGKPKDSWYYLVLTNNSFLFGQDWMCSFHFVEDIPEKTAEEEVDQTKGASQTITDVEEELRFYFERAYWDEIPAFNAANFEYQQKIQELLARRSGTFVHSVDPYLLVKRPENVIYDETFPEVLQDRLVGSGHTSLDAYRRIVGSLFSGEGSDYSYQISAMIPEEKGQTDGGQYLPVVYLFVFEAAAAKAEGAYTFISGQIKTFEELERDKVYEDEQFVVYDATDLFYGDLEAYAEFFVAEHGLHYDESIRTRVRNIRDYYRDRNNLEFYYPEWLNNMDPSAGAAPVVVPSE